jgi:hypothetical protein
MIAVRVGNLGFPLCKGTWGFHFGRIWGFELARNFGFPTDLVVTGACLSMKQPREGSAPKFGVCQSQGTQWLMSARVCLGMLTAGLAQRSTHYHEDYSMSKTEMVLLGVL